MISRLVTLKALGIALPAMALTAGSAAAATGSLPAPAQNVVSHALSHVGIDVPKGNDNSSPAGTPVGPNVSGPAKFGLCQAAQANNGHPSSHSVAFRNLATAAANLHESVTQFCAGATPGSGTNGSNENSGANNGANSGTDSKGGSKSHSGVTPPGPPSSTPGSGSTPEGPPSSTPASGTAPVSTPAGPPSSVPAGKP